MISQGEAYDWLYEHMIGPTSRGMASILSTQLSMPLAKLVNLGGKVLPDPYGWQKRIEDYAFETGFPDSLFIAGDGRLVGTWIMGNDYRVKSEYYGGYPNTYLPRVRALFRDMSPVLHLFSGKVDLTAYPGDTVDISADLNPTYVDDAQTLENVPLERYRIVLADPPYSVEDAEHYKTGEVKRNKVMRALKRLQSGAYIVWLDQSLPMWRKDTFELIGIVGVVRSSNHRFRVMNIYRRL